MNNYYITAGSKTRNPESYIRELEDKLDFEFEEHDSMYLGTYYRYTGLYADVLTIKKCSLEDENLKDFITIIEMSFNAGKEKDKKSTFNHMLKIFKKMKDTTIVKEEKISIA